MKKTCTMLLSLLLSLLMCMTALADTTSKNDMITIQNLIAERMNNEEIVFFEMGEKVSVEGQCVFTLTDLVSTESNNDGMMDIIAYLSIRSTVENLGLADYDFMLATKTASGNEDYYFPNAIYGYMNNQVQQLAWAGSYEHGVRNRNRTPIYRRKGNNGAGSGFYQYCQH